MLGDSEIEVRELEFYDAELKPGKLGTTPKDTLQIKVSDCGWVRFRIRRIAFR